MKKGVLGLLVVLLIFSFASVFAACDLDVSILNQDPYPAVPGEEAKVVFQVDGLETSDCGDVKFELVESYPISLSPDQVNSYTIEAGTFNKDFKSSFLAPFKIRIADNALDGSNPMEVRYKSQDSDYVLEDFNIEVADILADFEVYVKDYDMTTRTLVFEILNIAEADVEALTVEIPKQDNVVVKGPNVNIVGDLDSNEYTTADFEALPEDGEITLKISYSDSTNVRRVIEKKVMYESEYFQGRIADEKPSKVGTYVIVGVGVVLIVFWIYRRNKKKKAAHKRR